MSAAPETRSIRALRAIAGIAAAGAIVGYLGIGIAHLRTPHELEWIEGGMVDAVARLVKGDALYVEPTLDYVPFIYAPLWFHVAALSSKVFGVGFFAARLVSFLSSIGAMALIAAVAHKETKDRLAALLGAGLFAATYPIAASFYDLARVDSLFVVLLLGGIYLARFHTGVAGTVASALLFALAFLTKQSAPIVFGPVALYLLLTDRRRGAIFTVTGAALMAGSAFLYNRASGGWFWHFVFFLPSQHQIVKRQFLDFWLELFKLLGVTMVVGIAYFATGHRREDRRFWFFATAGMFGAALAGRLHLGGWSNVLCPAYAMLGVLLGVGVPALLDRIEAMSPDRRRLWVHALFAGVALQFALRVYDPRQRLATRTQAEAWRALIAAVQSIQGDVFVSAHGFIGPRAGKPAHAHQIAISDELRGGGTGPTAESLRRQIRRALIEKRFAGMIIDNPWLPKEQLEPNYQRRGEVPMRRHLEPVIGWQTAQPNSIWVAKP